MNRKYSKIRKITENPFLNLYQIDAHTKSGKDFTYYFASRNDEQNIKIRTHARRAEGMAVYAVTEEGMHLVMVKQYRYPLDKWIYELPAGLIETGETPEIAAIREMKEETGLNLCIYEGGEHCLRRAFYLAQGMSDESGNMIFGYASGIRGNALQEDSEDMEIVFIDRSQAVQLLRREELSIRAAYMLIHFIRSKSENPFEFLQLSTEL